MLIFKSVLIIFRFLGNAKNFIEDILMKRSLTTLISIIFWSFYSIYCAFWISFTVFITIITFVVKVVLDIGLIINTKCIISTI
jgi:hypothetical protein